MNSILCTICMRGGSQGVKYKNLKKINNQKKLRKFFLKSKVSRAVEKRLNINISSNLIKFDKEGLFITKNTKKKT